jgi:hypothetical protein
VTEYHTTAFAIAEALAKGLANMTFGEEKRTRNVDLGPVIPCEYMTADGHDMWSFDLTIDGREFVVAIADCDVMPDINLDEVAPDT